MLFRMPHKLSLVTTGSYQVHCAVLLVILKKYVRQKNVFTWGKSLCTQLLSALLRTQTWGKSGGEITDVRATLAEGL